MNICTCETGYVMTSENPVVCTSGSACSNSLVLNTNNICVCDSTTYLDATTGYCLCNRNATPTARNAN